MAYRVLSQNNSVTTLEDDQGNVIHIPSVASLAKSTDYTILKVKNSTATLEDGDGNTYRDVPCVVVLADDSSSYTPIAQNNTKTTLESSDNNIIHIPSKVVLASSTDFTIVKVNNSTATLEDGSGNIIRDVPCVSMLADESYSITKVNNSTATLSNDGKTIRDVPCIVILAKTSGAVEVIIKGTSPLNLPDAIADSLQYVKAFGGTEQRNLPDGYIQRQFIYMMDGSYLLTDIVPTYDCKIEMDFATTNLPSSSVTFIGGRSGDSIGDGLQLAKPTNGNFIIDAFDSTRYVSNVAPTSNTRYKFTFNNQVATLESAGSTLFTNTFTGTDATGGAIAINALNTNGTITGNAAGMYLYSFKAWNAQGELVANYVPVIQKGAVTVVGFYDTVSGTFKTATEGTFAAGGEAVPSPDTPMDIVSNNGVLKVSKNLFDKNNITPINGYIAASGTTWTGSNNGYSLRIPCEPNTTYTARYNGNSTQAVLGFGSTNTDEIPVSGIDVTITQAIRQNNPTISTPITITTGANDKWLIIAYNKTDPQNTDMANNLQVEQGATATDYMPYGQIYTDGTVETISARGKNLLDMAAENVVVGKYINNSGVVTDSDLNFYNSKYIPVVASGTYTWSTSSSVGYFSVMEYDSDYVFTQRTLFGTGGSPAGTAGTITLRSDTAFVLIGSNIDSTRVTRAKINAINWQFEKGSTATDYVPYYDDVTATAEMLLKVGDYQDEQEILSGAVTRKVGVKVLDGTETWTITAISGHRVFTVIKTDIGTSSTVLPAGSLKMICTHFIPHTNSGYTDGDVWAGTTGVNFVKDNFSTVTEWTNWLSAQYAAGTPVIIVYPLATPTTESVTGQTLQLTDGDNVLEITQASLDNLELEAQYQAAVQLTIQEVEDANLDNNVEVTIS